MNIATILREIATIAASAGLAKPYLVGGAVRDLLSGREPLDYDITCGSSDSLRLAELVGRHFGSPIYKMRSGSVKVLVGGHELDFSPCTIYGDLPESLESETRSRDYTINAILMDLSDGKILDMFGGVQHLRDKVLEPCDPQLFRSDPVRAYRALKFIAEGYTPSADVVDFIRQNAAQNSRHVKSLLNAAIRRDDRIIDFLIDNQILRQVPITATLVTALKNRRQLHLC